MTVITTHRFTVEEYYRMHEAGFFEEGAAVELIEGEIVDMSPIGSLHAMCVNLLNRLFHSFLIKTNLLDSLLIVVQNPIHLSSTSEPEPDVVLVKAGDYSEAHPKPDDVILIVEVSDTTVAFDRDVKVPLYAQYRIPETWRIDLGEKYIEQYWEPTPDGYLKSQILRTGQVISVKSFPQLQIPISEILKVKK